MTNITLNVIVTNMSTTIIYTNPPAPPQRPFTITGTIQGGAVGKKVTITATGTPQ